jgi:hypothetical protein
MPPGEGSNFKLNVMKFNARVVNALSGGALFKVVFKMRDHIDEENYNYVVKASAHRARLNAAKVKVIDVYQDRNSRSGAFSSKRLRSKS